MAGWTVERYASRTDDAGATGAAGVGAAAAAACFVARGALSDAERSVCCAAGGVSDEKST